MGGGGGALGATVLRINAAPCHSICLFHMWAHFTSIRVHVCMRCLHVTGFIAMCHPPPRPRCVGEVVKAKREQSDFLEATADGHVPQVQLECMLTPRTQSTCACCE